MRPYLKQSLVAVALAGLMAAPALASSDDWDTPERAAQLRRAKEAQMERLNAAQTAYEKALEAAEAQRQAAERSYTKAEEFQAQRRAITDGRNSKMQHGFDRRLEEAAAELERVRSGTGAPAAAGAGVTIIGRTPGQGGSDPVLTSPVVPDGQDGNAAKGGDAVNTSPVVPDGQDGTAAKGGDTVNTSPGYADSSPQDPVLTSPVVPDGEAGTVSKNELATSYVEFMAQYKAAHPTAGQTEAQAAWQLRRAELLAERRAEEAKASEEAAQKAYEEAERRAREIADRRVQEAERRAAEARVKLEQIRRESAY